MSVTNATLTPTEDILKLIFKKSLVPIDITGFLIIFHVKETPNTADIITLSTTNGGITVIDALQGKISVNISNVPKVTYFVLEWFDTLDIQKTLLIGSMVRQ